MIGYHFTGDTLRDRRPIPAIGEWLVHKGPVVPCESGLHASEHPFDALRYAPGPLLHRVELDGDLQSHGDPIDKWVGQRRRILQSVDATQLLRRFACDQALQVLPAAAPQIVRDYLTSADESLRAAARDAAARAAARDAAAARAAAWDAAARAAARDAARAAAWAAAWAAERDAAWDAAARDAAWDAARRDFLQRVEAALC